MKIKIIDASGNERLIFATDKDAARKVKQAAERFGAKAKETAGRCGEKTKAAAEKYGEKAKAAAEKYGGKAKAAAEKYGEKVKEAAEKYSEKAKAAAEKYGEKAKDAAGRYGAVVKEKAGHIKEKFSGVSAKKAGDPVCGSDAPCEDPAAEVENVEEEGAPEENGEADEGSGDEDGEAPLQARDGPPGAPVCPQILCNMARAVRSGYEQVREDVAAVRARDPAAKSDLEVLTLYSGLHAVLAYRLAHSLHEKGFELTARAISQGAKFLTGIEIHPGAQIGRQLFIDHGTGVVIGETTIIGDRCTIYQGATLGGTGKETGKRHPTIGDDVMIGSGAKVLGPVNIGDHTKIAAGAVVLKDIPPHCTAVGIPARIVRQMGERVDDLDQIHIPDPVEKEFEAIREELRALKDRIDP